MLHINRKMENILEGLAEPQSYLTADDELQIHESAYENSRRYWTCKGGPLRPRSEGGVNVVIIDSPPLLTLALLSKEQDPTRPVVFENRLFTQNGSLEDQTGPQARAWDFVNTRLQHVDLLVSPVPKELAPLTNMPGKQIGYIPVSVDQ